MELGTSSKMRRFVPLLAGGGLFETGAGGSAPKHVERSGKRAICAGIRSASSSPSRVARTSGADLQERQGAGLAETLDTAIGKSSSSTAILRAKSANSTIASHFYLALYWAQAGCADKDAELQARFKPLAETLAKNEAKINAELIGAQGSRSTAAATTCRIRQDIGAMSAERHAERRARHALTRPPARPRPAFARRRASAGWRSLRRRLLAEGGKRGPSPSPRTGCAAFAGMSGVTSTSADWALAQGALAHRSTPESPTRLSGQESQCYRARRSCRGCIFNERASNQSDDRCRCRVSKGGFPKWRRSR